MLLIDEGTGAALIYQERERQIKAEGWAAEHDDAHRNRSDPAQLVLPVPGSTHPQSQPIRPHAARVRRAQGSGLTANARRESDV
jgi:hypothetical protein